MEVITIQSDAYKAILAKLESLEQKLVDDQEHDRLITNEELCLLLNISKRTAQHYRDSGLIQFSQPQAGAKVYYKLSWVNEMIEKHKCDRINP